MTFVGRGNWVAPSALGVEIGGESNESAPSADALASGPGSLLIRRVLCDHSRGLCDRRRNLAAADPATRSSKTSPGPLTSSGVEGGVSALAGQRYTDQHADAVGHGRRRKADSKLS